VTVPSPGRSGAGQAADEQEALRQVAVLMAQSAQPAAVFAAVAREAGQLLSVDATGIFRYDPDGVTTCVGQWVTPAAPVPFVVGTSLHLGGRNVLTLIAQTGRRARVEQTDEASGEVLSAGRKRGFGPVVGAPITVDGRLWGAMVALSRAGRSVPPDTEARLAGFTELAGTAIAIAQSRVALKSFADEQAALRRVATLVAGGATPHQVFSAVAEEAGMLLSADGTGLVRYDPHGAATTVGDWTRPGDVSAPSVGAVASLSLGGLDVQAMVAETGRAVRLDRLDDAPAPVEPVEPVVREHGFRSAVGVPITVDGRLWGALLVVSRSAEPLAADTEERLTGFTSLAATAVADAQARAQLRGYADEQAALRRVATLVAGGARPREVFAAVTAEAGKLLPADYTILTRHDQDGRATVVGAWAGQDLGHPLPVGLRLAVGGRNIQTLLIERRRPARVDDHATATGAVAETLANLGVRAAVGVPIWVDGRLWGSMIAGLGSSPLPTGTEERLAGFTELAATALANAEAEGALTASRARIVAAADQTRRRVERDLHDGVQQRLVSLALRLRAEQAQLPPEAGATSQRLGAAIADSVGLQEELREISHGLYPAILAESGLRPALRALARRAAVPVSVDVRVPDRLAEPVETTAYYAVSEALANVACHAGATAAAEVSVVAEDGLLRIEVRDDGRGGADFSRGSGLMEIRDRVEAFRGRITLSSPPGAGTRLEVELPIDGPAGGDDPKSG
jgi:signal transduction histidine kinase